MRARDHGLRRISDVTRWLIAGAVALTGALAVLADRSFHGHASSTAAASSSVASSSTTAATNQGSATATPLQSAQSSPTVTPAAPVVVSGGS
jgi:hypothetical protein